MRRIVAWLFLSLDGVMESPEQWVMFNDEMGEAINAEAAAADSLLLGRRTYEVFAASWPYRSVDDDPLANWMNNTPKLVASSTLTTVEWRNSTQIKGDVAKELPRTARPARKEHLDQRQRHPCPVAAARQPAR